MSVISANMITSTSSDKPTHTQNTSHATGVDRPVFVVGTARSGLTPLMDLIAYHKDLAWPSQYNKRFPNRHSISILSRIVDLPLFNSRLKYRKFVPTHDESYPFWNQLFYGWSAPFRDLVADDVTPTIKRKFLHAVSEVIRFSGKKRFIAEYSGWSRIGFLNAIFPDARFIHIVRDGRAVANSYTNVHWWHGWRGVYGWRWGVPPEPYLAKLEEYGYSFLALAAIHWKMLINNILNTSASLGDERVMLVRYEEMVKDPQAMAAACLEFMGLDSDDKRFRKHLSTVKIVDANHKTFRIAPWKDNVTAKQLEMLNDLLGDELRRLEYPVGEAGPSPLPNADKQYARLGV